MKLVRDHRSLGDPCGSANGRGIDSHDACNYIIRLQDAQEAADIGHMSVNYSVFTSSRLGHLEFHIYL